MNRDNILIGNQVEYIDHESIYPIIRTGTVNAKMDDGFFIVNGRKRHAYSIYCDYDTALLALEGCIEQRMNELSKLLIECRKSKNEVNNERSN